MKNFMTFLLALTATQLLSATDYKWKGTSTFEQGDCQMSYTLDGMKMTSLVVEGETKVWEVIAENDGGYGPDSYITVDQFTMMEQGLYDVKKSVWGGWYVKESIKVPDTAIAASISLELKGKSVDQLESFHLKSQFKGLIVIPLASSEFDCKNLQKIE